MISYTDFDFKTKEGEILCYIHLYMTINGVISISKMLYFLNDVHNLNVKEEKIKELVEKLEDVTLVDSYLCIMGMPYWVVKEILKNKIAFGNYKEIDNLENFEEDYNNNVLNIVNLLKEYIDEDVVVDLFKCWMFLKPISSGDFDRMLTTYKVVLAVNDKRKLYRSLENSQKNVRLWYYNGFKIDEVKSYAKNV